MNKEKFWLGFFLVLGFFIVGGTVVGYVKYDVPEDYYCMELIETHFPEYDIINAGYNGDAFGSCYVRYRNKNEGEQRNGLQEQPEGIRKDFKLTNQKDIDYMKSDNNRNFICILLLILGTVMVIVSMQIIGGEA